MIKLHPIPEAIYHCPFDGTKLKVLDWYIPGMHTLADLRCLKCDREFFGDLPAGHGLSFPVLLEKKTGNIFDPQNAYWFANWLRDSYASRRKEHLAFETEEFRPLRNPLLLNCLDALYGHCLLKLLNAQYYLEKRSEFDLIVLIPKCLRWLVPDGVAQIWTIDLPLNRGIEWNDCLAAEISARLKQFDEVWLSVAYSHPHPKDFSIERFTRVQPFPVDEWRDRLERPTVTFIWREDRFWGEQGNLRWLRIWAKKLRLDKILNNLSFTRREQIQKAVTLSDMSLPRRGQIRRVVLLASCLRKLFPKLDFAVVGLGKPGGLPSWIEDLRTMAIDDTVEKTWCDRYAKSHVVIGVHGSNMLLPSAHAGATIDLMPPERWQNMIQDILMPNLDCREILYRYHMLPTSISVQELTFMIESLLCSFYLVELDYRHCSIDHDPGSFAEMHSRRLLYKAGSS